MITEWQITSVPIPFSFGEWKSIQKKRHQEEREGIDGARKIRVIVIDDEPVIADTVVEILNGEGFDAMAVSTGTSAIELARAFDPDVVLSDVIVPGLNGIESGIRIREIAPNYRVILFSGQAATVDLLEEARQQGHRFDILAKPIRPEQLISVIRASSR
jgi:DNA-binding response OmpR family regulator